MENSIRRIHIRTSMDLLLPNSPTVFSRRKALAQQERGPTKAHPIMSRLGKVGIM